MAGLMEAAATGSVLRRQQFAAIAWLRWRLFVNNFRRKGAKTEMFARFVMVPLIGLLAIGPILAAAGVAWYALAKNHTELIPAVFWGVFALQVIVSLNIAQPGLSFDAELLIRFPLTFARYLTVRLFLGLLSASTVVGTLALLAAAGAATFAKPSVGPIFFAAAVTLALTNMLLLRMIFAWVDRWLSTRRARELFTGMIIVLSIGFQYLNVTFNPGFGGNSVAGRAAKLATLRHVYHTANPVLRLLPPGFAASSVALDLHGRAAAAWLNLLGVVLFALLFLTVFAYRMRQEFGGENLSEAGARTQGLQKAGAAAHTIVRTSSPSASLDSARARWAVSPPIAACLTKEWIYLRRNTAQFYAVLGPLAMVLLFSSRMSRISHPAYIFPAAMVYSLLGICALSYNVFGLDATGIQFYFLAPVRFRSIVVAKNLFGFFFLALDAVLVYCVILFISARPTLLMTLTTLAWVVFAALLNATVGNLRSITTPKKMDPGKLSRRQASQMSALLAVALTLLAAAAGFGLLLLGGWMNRPWLPAACLVLLAAAAAAVYLFGLDRVDQLALRCRETMLEELTKTA